MSWEHYHYKTAFAVFLHSGDDCNPPPAAVFADEKDADAYIASERRKRFEEDADDWVRRHPGKGYQNSRDFARETGATVEDYLSDAMILHVRNAYLPVWNSIDEPTDGNPSPVPDYAADEVMRSLDPLGDHGKAVVAVIDRETAEVSRRLEELKQMRAAVTG